MSKDAKQNSGLVAQAARNQLATQGAPGGSVVDMQDLMPIIQSFQDHMSAEQTRQRERIRGLTTLFVLALVVAFALPLWVVRGLLRDHQHALEAQLAAQAQQSQSLEKALLEVAASSRALREELSQPRVAGIAPEAVPAPPADTNAPPAGDVPAPAPLPVAGPPPTVEPAPAATNAPATNVVVLAPAPAPAATNAPATIAAAAAAPVPRNDSDLVNELRKIEQALAEKQRQLQQRPKP